MGYVLFFLWLVVLSWWLTRSRFIQQSGLSNSTIIGLFCCKVAAGVVMGRMVQFSVPIVDTWGFHEEGLEEYHLLFSNPVEYCTNLFHSIYTDKYAGVFVAKDSYWNDLRDNLMAKLLSVLNLLSFGHYYVNVVLFNFLLFFGNVALYRVFRAVLKTPAVITLFACFLLPSFLLYTSIIHKDGLIMAAIGAILFLVMRMLNDKITLKRLLPVLACLLLIFFLRNVVALSLLPALLALVIATKTSARPIFVFGAVYSIGLLLFFLLPHLLPALDFPGYIAQRQEDFIGLGPSNTSIPIHALEPAFMSFFRNAPQAITHSLARPFITDYKLSPWLIPFSLELLVYGCLLIALFVFKQKLSVFQDPVVLFGLFFSLTICLVIGYTIPILGAIVRYRSIYLPFLIAPVVACIPWSRMIPEKYISKTDMF